MFDVLIINKDSVDSDVVILEFAFFFNGSHYIYFETMDGTLFERPNGQISNAITCGAGKIIKYSNNNDINYLAHAESMNRLVFGFFSGKIKTLTLADYSEDGLYIVNMRTVIVDNVNPLTEITIPFNDFILDTPVTNIIINGDTFFKTPTGNNMNYTVQQQAIIDIMTPEKQEVMSTGTIEEIAVVVKSLSTTNQELFSVIIALATKYTVEQNAVIKTLTPEQQSTFATGTTTQKNAILIILTPSVHDKIQNL